MASALVSWFESFVTNRFAQSELLGSKIKRKLHLGTPQGGVLSPILFSIYINKLIEKLRETGIGIKLEEGRINALFYADDIILIAETRKELQD